MHGHSYRAPSYASFLHLANLVGIHPIIQPHRFIARQLDQVIRTSQYDLVGSTSDRHHKASWSSALFPAPSRPAGPQPA